MDMSKSSPRGVWHAFRHSRAGNFATMSALFAPVAIGLAAVAVDEASLYLQRREAQSVTDLAAIAAAANLANPRAAALQTLKDNGLLTSMSSDEGGKEQEPNGSGDVPLDVEPGKYVADPAVKVEKRFVGGATPNNAVRVTFEETGRRYFSRAFFDAPRIVTTATASTSAQAAFSVGSRLLNLDGGILNAILGGLTGSELELSVMDYDALLSADADLLTFFGALATNLDLEGATYNELLDADVSMGGIAAALQRAEGMGARARGAADTLRRAMSAPSTPRLRLGDLFDLGPLEGRLIGANVPGLALNASALEILTTAAAVADGKHQVSLDLGASIPGLLGVTLDLAIGEPPQHSAWFALGRGGEIVRTAQTRLRFVATVGGPGGLVGASVRLPIYLDIAFAEAKLADIVCTSGRDDSVRVKIDARPGVADLRIADMNTGHLDDFDTPPPLEPARIVEAPLVSVTGAAHAEVSNLSYQRLVFDRDDIDDLAIKQVSTTDLTSSLVASLLGDLDLEVNVAGIGIGLPGLVTNTVAHTLQAATPAIDKLLVNVLSALGIAVGEADIRVHSATCGRAVLVQ